MATVLPFTAGLGELSKALEVPAGLRAPPELTYRIPKPEEDKFARLIRLTCDDAASRMWPWRRKWRVREEWTNGNFQATVDNVVEVVSFV